MGVNLAGLRVIFNNTSGLNQGTFQLLGVPGSLTLVAINGVIQNPSTYTIDRSILTFTNPLPSGSWLYVVSGQGGTFTPQSYVDDVAATKPSREELDNALATKANKSGAAFTGPITVQEPVAAMNPVTKQMFDTLPDDIATIDYVDDAVGDMVTLATFNTAVSNLLGEDDKGMADGITENDGNGKVKLTQMPLQSVYFAKSVEISGVLAANQLVETWREKYAGIVSSIVVSLGAAPTGAPLRINLTKNGTNVFNQQADYITVPAGNDDHIHTFSTPPTFVAGTVLGLRIMSVGSGITGADLDANIEVNYIS